MDVYPEVSCLMVLALYIPILLSSAQKHEQSMRPPITSPLPASWHSLLDKLPGGSRKEWFLWEPAFPNGKQSFDFGHIVSVKHLRLVLE